VESGATIHAFSHLEGASVAGGAQVGPYARLRPGAQLDKGAKVGNFVEVKKAHIEQGAKVNHLTYIGDARVGAGANVGAGVITCNYDGFDKYFTDIGEGAFIGSNTALVAPVVVEAGAYVGSGSVITKTVEKDALGLTRPDFKQIGGWAAKFRARKQKEKPEGKKGK
jgi:bifunctional UDP-N-acetylglucosamine pyrophosphorylase/glucosamine-1-phosphate N-acetyltransferase